MVLFGRINFKLYYIYNNNMYIQQQRRMMWHQISLLPLSLQPLTQAAASRVFTKWAVELIILRKSLLASKLNGISILYILFYFIFIVPLFLFMFWILYFAIRFYVPTNIFLYSKRYRTFLISHLLLRILLENQL